MKAPMEQAFALIIYILNRPPALTLHNDSYQINGRGFDLPSRCIFLIIICLYNDLALEYGFESLAVRALAVALHALRQHFIVYPAKVVSDLLW